MDQSVENAVSECGIPDLLTPVRHRELRGEDGLSNKPLIVYNC